MATTSHTKRAMVYRLPPFEKGGGRQGGFYLQPEANPPESQGDLVLRKIGASGQKGVIALSFRNGSMECGNSVTGCSQ